MGKGGRFACIILPMVLSLASLICLIIVFIGGWNKKDSNLSNLYFFSANTTAFDANASGVQDLLKNADQNTKDLVNGLVGQVSANKLKDIYYIYLWNYCSGNLSGGNKTTVELDYCSGRQSSFYFNPIQEWGLNGTIVQQKIPGALDKALSAYQKGAQWMFIAYSIAFFATLAAIVVGLFAICSRVGSCVTTIVSAVSTLFSVLSALTSTILFSTLVGGLNGVLKPYKIELKLGGRMLAVDWLAAAFSIAASLFWLVSICCCSGRSSRAPKGPQDHHSYAYGANRGAYKPLEDPTHSNRTSAYSAQQPHQNHEMQEFGTVGAGPYKGRENNTAYEPFRHV